MTAPRPWTPPLTVADVAERLNVSKMTIYRLVETKELEAFRLGRSLRITTTQLERFLRSANTAREGGR